MKMLRTTIIWSLGLISSVLAWPALSAPITVQSVLFDYDDDVLTVGPPSVDPNGNPVQNGDFLIFRISTAADVPVGNGIDDRTRGIFDFRTDANYSAFSSLLAQPHGKIFAATLRLVLTVADPFFINDQISLENGPFTGDPQIGQQLDNNPFLPNGISKLVTLNLLDFYSQEQLENFLSGGTGDFVNDGRIVLTYGDDAIVSGAALTLTANVPEPTTLALIVLGLAGLAATRRRKQ